VPAIFRYKGYRFFFYSNEGNPREAMHVHVRGGDGEAKFWINPVCLASSTGLNAKALRELAEVVEQNIDLIEEAWNEHFG
jgi:hypothetical protein